MGEVLDVQWVESVVARLIAEGAIEPTLADTARVVLYPFVIGTTNPDRIAEASGLNRDFVRGKAKALRDNGVWVSEAMKPGYSTLDRTEEDTHVLIVEVVLHIMAAEGQVFRRVSGDRSTWVIKPDGFNRLLSDQEAF